MKLKQSTTYINNMFNITFIFHKEVTNIKQYNRRKILHKLLFLLIIFFHSDLDTFNFVFNKMFLICL